MKCSQGRLLSSPSNTLQRLKRSSLFIGDKEKKCFITLILGGVQGPPHLDHRSRGRAHLQAGDPERREPDPGLGCKLTYF